MLNTTKTTRKKKHQLNQIINNKHVSHIIHIKIIVYTVNNNYLNIYLMMIIKIVNCIQNNMYYYIEGDFYLFDDKDNTKQ